jgi:hypothetical protein
VCANWPVTSASSASSVSVVANPGGTRRLTQPTRVPAYDRCDGEDPAN